MQKAGYAMVKAYTLVHITRFVCIVISVATLSRCCAFFDARHQPCIFYLEEKFMDYKEEFFKVFEVLDDVKIALDDALICIEKMQEEVLGDFVDGNASKVDAGRMARHITPKNRKTYILR